MKVKNGEFIIKSNYASPTFTMVNGIGEKINLNYTNLGKDQYKISTKNVTPGLYFLILESQGKVFTSKVLME